MDLVASGAQDTHRVETVDEAQPQTGRGLPCPQKLLRTEAFVADGLELRDQLFITPRRYGRKLGHIPKALDGFVHAITFGIWSFILFTAAAEADASGFIKLEIR